MLEDALRHQYVLDMDEDQVMVQVEEEVMVQMEEEIMVQVDITEMHLQETNTKKEETHDLFMEDKVVVVEKNGN